MAPAFIFDEKPPAMSMKRSPKQAGGMEKLMTLEELEQIANERRAAKEISTRVECLRCRGLLVFAQRCDQVGTGEGSAAHRSELPRGWNGLLGALLTGTAGERRA